MIKMNYKTVLTFMDRKDCCIFQQHLPRHQVPGSQVTININIDNITAVPFVGKLQQ